MKGKKKLLTLPLAAAMVLSLAVPAMAAEETSSPEESAKAAFTDVAADRWSVPYLRAAADRGVMPADGASRPAAENQARVSVQPGDASPHGPPVR